MILKSQKFDPCGTRLFRRFSTKIDEVAPTRSKNFVDVRNSFENKKFSWRISHVDEVSARKKSTPFAVDFRLTSGRPLKGRPGRWQRGESPCPFWNTGIARVKLSFLTNLTWRHTCRQFDKFVKNDKFTLAVHVSFWRSSGVSKVESHAVRVKTFGKRRVCAEIRSSMGAYSR